MKNFVKHAMYATKQVTFNSRPLGLFSCYEIPTGSWVDKTPACRSSVNDIHHMFHARYLMIHVNVYFINTTLTMKLDKDS